MLLFTREGFTFSLKRHERWQDDCVYPTINWAGTDLFEVRPHFSSILSLFGSRIPVMLTGKWAPLSCHLSLSLSLSLSLHLSLSVSLQPSNTAENAILAFWRCQLEPPALHNFMSQRILKWLLALWWCRPLASGERETKRDSTLSFQFSMNLQSLIPSCFRKKHPAPLCLT